MIVGHAASEFLFDFLTAFYPTPSVGARVILPAGQAPKFLTTLKGALQQYQNAIPETAGDAAEGMNLNLILETRRNGAPMNTDKRGK